MKLIPRGDTTVVDAYLSPILRRYVDQLADEMPGVRLLFMQSSGGLTEARRFQGKDAILSGPAGGIIGMVQSARAAGHERLIGFDMGGTSTDVSHYAGEYERAFDTEVGGRAYTRAHDEHSQHRGRRRFHHSFRRGAAARGTGIGRRQSRSRVLSAWRSADDHRCEPDARAHSAAVLSASLRGKCAINRWIAPSWSSASPNWRNGCRGAPEAR